MYEWVSWCGVPTLLEKWRDQREGCPCVFGGSCADWQACRRCLTSHLCNDVFVPVSDDYPFSIFV